MFKDSGLDAEPRKLANPLLKYSHYVVYCYIRSICIRGGGARLILAGGDYVASNVSFSGFL